MQKNMKTKCLSIAALLIWSIAASAHDAAGPHGGRITHVGAYHIEMVVKSDAVDVFVSDVKDQPVPAAGFRGIAILVVDGKSQRIVLEPDGGRLSGKAPLALSTQPKGVVQLTAPDGKAAQGQFK